MGIGPRRVHVARNLGALLVRSASRRDGRACSRRCASSTPFRGTESSVLVHSPRDRLFSLRETDVETVVDRFPDFVDRQAPTQEVKQGGGDRGGTAMVADGARRCQRSRGQLRQDGERRIVVEEMYHKHSLGSMAIASASIVCMDYFLPTTFAGRLTGTIHGRMVGGSREGAVSRTHLREPRQASLSWIISGQRLSLDNSRERDLFVGGGHLFRQMSSMEPSCTIFRRLRDTETGISSGYQPPLLCNSLSGSGPPNIYWIRSPSPHPGVSSL